jgi:ribosomal 50S subunit-recycling heat shock protein
VEKLKNEIVIGCVNSEDHLHISDKLNYENYHKFLYGISVDCDGQITVHNKGHKPSTIIFTKVKINDMIELTLHTKNSTITIIKYSRGSEATEEERDAKNTIKMEYASLTGKMTNRTIIATLPIELI